MKKYCRVNYGLNFSNGSKDDDDRQILNIEVASFDISNEKITEVKEMIEKFVENEVVEKLGW